MTSPDDPISKASGGVSFNVLSGLIWILIERGIVSQQEIREMVDGLLLSAEQQASADPEEAAHARTLLATLLASIDDLSDASS